VFHVSFPFVGTQTGVVVHTLREMYDEIFFMVSTCLEEFSINKNSKDKYVHSEIIRSRIEGPERKVVWWPNSLSHVVDIST
jgi:hypothetical protein